MKYLQKLGKALMLPVACLPICGILMGIGYVLFSASLPAAQKTRLIIPLGIAAFVVFYLVFRFVIVKFDLKTPGREDDEEEEATVELANNDYTAIAATILEGLGGKQTLPALTTALPDFVWK